MADVPEYAVTAIGADRPGIVAAVADALVEVGGNVEDSAMTILGGQFAIVLLVATAASRDELTSALAARTEDFGLTIHVSQVAARSAEERSPAPTHVLSVYGSDKPGILAGVTRALADLGINVTDLETQLLNPSGAAVYAMIIELVCEDEAALAERLARACDELGVDHTLRPLDAEML